MDVVDLKEKFDLFDEYWSPRVAGRLNGQVVKLVKLKGEFVWHHHEAEDEMFMVIRGRMRIRLRNRDVTVKEGQFFIIPRGVEHMPVADEECHVLLFEPEGVLNTGNLKNERTVEDLKEV